jgi:hypothetical protein
MFADPVTIAHAGGHYIPTNREIRQLYCRFMHNMLDDLKTDDKLLTEESIFAPEANSPEHFAELPSEKEQVSPSEFIKAVH